MFTSSVLCVLSVMLSLFYLFISAFLSPLMADAAEVVRVITYVQVHAAGLGRFQLLAAFIGSVAGR
ncbi:Voltage-dependent L-type calcium channel subunit beta-2 [Daphnia magna]|uniref:Voltage-dependent L-type calcium channel subunit beta-2 n=1 Tax=Daphnia magna TaxID=35525 RepID=A0A164V662_9CRUS|nr:Voltage-dependent L-type calcium channel subunit beta-2 [Daphnia magna]